MELSSNWFTSLPSETIKNWTVFLNAVELFVIITALLISAFNFTLLYNTALLHPNLKFILLVQSTIIVLQQSTRIVYVALKFIYADPFYHGAFHVQTVGMVTIWFRNLIGPVLMAERAFATIKFRTYTMNYCNKQFAISWIGILLAISIWNTYIHQGVFYFVDLSTLVSASILLALGIIELLSLSAIYFYNLRKYKCEIYLKLNERFQLAENIRTARQFAPTFFIHFLNANVFYLVIMLLFFGFLDQRYEQSFAFLFSSIQNSIGCLFIEITVIT